MKQSTCSTAHAAQHMQHSTCSTAHAINVANADNADNADNIGNDIMQTKESAVRLVKAIYPDITKVSDFMLKANELYAANNASPGGFSSIKPYSGEDIAFAKFSDFLAEHASQRERNLVYVSEFLNKAWHVLHVSVQVLKEDIAESEQMMVVRTLKALEKLELQSILLDGLNKKTSKILTGWLEDFSDGKPVLENPALR